MPLKLETNVLKVSFNFGMFGKKMLKFKTMLKLKIIDNHNQRIYHVIDTKVGSNH